VNNGVSIDPAKAGKKNSNRLQPPLQSTYIWNIQTDRINDCGIDAHLLHAR